MKSPAPYLSAESRRVIKLDQCVKAATWWLLALGACYLLTGEVTAYRLHLRYLSQAEPLLRLLGLAYLLLGLYLRRTAAEPENQVLTVDLLCVFFFMQAYVFLRCQIGGIQVFAGEWVIGAVSLGLGACLFLWRTQSTAAPVGTPGAQDAKLAARETIARLKRLIEEKKRTHPLPSPEAAPGKAKPLGEVEPHMD
jgi:hypothetical protein